jgi:hypothetical protein
MQQVIYLAKLRGTRTAYGLLLDSDTRTVLGVYGPLRPRERQAVLAGKRPFDSSRADWARRQRWELPYDLVSAPTAVLAKTVAPEPINVLAKTLPIAPLHQVAKTAVPTPGHRPCWYRQRLVRCGNPRCTKCVDGPSHGPYWYALWREDGRLRSRYLGAERPHDAPEPPA